MTSNNFPKVNDKDISPPKDEADLTKANDDFLPKGNLRNDIILTDQPKQAVGIVTTTPIEAYGGGDYSSDGYPEVMRYIKKWQLAFGLD